MYKRHEENIQKTSQKFCMFGNNTNYLRKRYILIK